MQVYISPGRPPNLTLRCGAHGAECVSGDEYTLSPQWSRGVESCSERLVLLYCTMTTYPPQYFTSYKYVLQNAYNDNFFSVGCYVHMYIHICLSTVHTVQYVQSKTILVLVVPFLLFGRQYMWCYCVPALLKGTLAQDFYHLRFIFIKSLFTEIFKFEDH